MQDCEFDDNDKVCWNCANSQNEYCVADEFHLDLANKGMLLLLKSDIKVIDIKCDKWKRKED